MDACFVVQLREPIHFRLAERTGPTPAATTVAPNIMNVPAFASVLVTNRDNGVASAATVRPATIDIAIVILSDARATVTS